MTRPREAAILSALFLSGLLALGFGTTHESRASTRGSQQITDTRFGLAASPLYKLHREEPMGGAVAAAARGDARIDVVVDREWNWLSWSALLIFFGLGAMSGSLVGLIRMRKGEDRAR